MSSSLTAAGTRDHGATPADEPSTADPSTDEPSTAELFVPIEPGPGRTDDASASESDPAGTGTAQEGVASGGPLVAALATLIGPDSPADRRDTGTIEPVTIEPSTGRRRSAGRSRRAGRATPRWQKIAFGLLIVALVGAIPVLSVAGYRLVTQSTDGTYTTNRMEPTDPGYEELVEPTPTSLIIQTDREGAPVGLTFVALGPEAGGSVIFVPLDTEVAVRAYGVDRLRTVYAHFADRPAVGREQLANQVGRLLNVAIDEVIEIDDRSWAQLVEPVGAFTVANPDPVATDDHDFAAGEIEVGPDEIGPYLAASAAGESDLSRLVRHGVLWRAWLGAHRDAGDDLDLPASSGALGELASRLAAGQVDMVTLPVRESDAAEEPNLFVSDSAAVVDLVAAAVPAPLAPVPGSRANVRILNGVDASPVPPELVHAIVRAQGSVTVVGNAVTFGQSETTLIYNDPAHEEFVDAIVDALGVDVVPRLDLEAPDTVDITVVLGRDAVDS